MQKGTIPRYDQVFLTGTTRPVGTVRKVAPRGRSELVVRVKNAGNFSVPFKAVADIHFCKVFLDRDQLGPDLLRAIDRTDIAESG